MTRYGLHSTTQPLAEARVLYELGANGVLETSALQRRARDRRRAAEPPAQAPRGAAPASSGSPSPADARRQQVGLTPAGEKRFRDLDEGSREEVGALLDALPDPEAALEAMQRLQQRDRADARQRPSAASSPATSAGWSSATACSTPASTAGTRASSASSPRSPPSSTRRSDRAWIAEVDGARAGAVLCVHDTPQTAKLRTLLVEPRARGLGLGHALVDEVIQHARRRGYRTLTLWTNDILHAARRIYERAGFTLQHEAPHHAFGHDLTEQTWSLTLQPWTETH